MTEGSLVSCVVPVYNGERYLREALDSILAQTYRPLELIVVDSGSTDGSVQAVSDYGRQIRLLVQDRAGPAAARNLGLGAAQGEFIAFLDQDDLWHPDKLARQMARFHACPALDVCITHIQVFWMPEMSREEQRLKGHQRMQPLPGYVTTTLLARQTVFENVGPFDATLWFADGTNWFLRAAEQGVVVELLPDVLVYHRMHQKNLTRRRSSASRDEFLMVVKMSLDRRRHREGNATRSHNAPTCKEYGKP